MTCALYSGGNITLMLGAGARNAAMMNFSVLTSVPWMMTAFPSNFSKGGRNGST